MTEDQEFLKDSLLRLLGEAVERGDFAKERELRAELDRVAGRAAGKEHR